MFVCLRVCLRCFRLEGGTSCKSQYRQQADILKPQGYLHGGHCIMLPAKVHIRIPVGTDIRGKDIKLGSQQDS